MEAAVGDCRDQLADRRLQSLEKFDDLGAFDRAIEQAKIESPVAKLLIIWDGLQAHRSKLVRAHVEAQRGRIVLERLPAYAPEANSVECIWGYLKHHAMPNRCATNFLDLAQRARRNLCSMQRRATLVTAFWKQAEMF
ncbi:MAG: hypothetical protein HIU85_03300 [Proteobacteria bacterium]|nr:hypothetical protein [Pseudomonadota bacterium]